MKIREIKVVEPSASDLRIFTERLIPLRDAGCQILLPAVSFEKVLVTNSSGGYYFAPSPGISLGFTFDPKLISPNNKNLPIIKHEPYSHCPEFMVFVDHTGYYIYRDHITAFSSPTIVAGRPMYGLDPKFLIKTGAFARST